ncbi:hypothetical protein ID866_7177 [Astraeus odoratus]|nr:hypothetical protein ID866_7177 [Astraeus odoratus]
MAQSRRQTYAYVGYHVLVLVHGPRKCEVGWIDDTAGAYWESI